MFKGLRQAQRIIDEAKLREETIALQAKRAKYERESPEAQMRHIRTHIAAQASQISSILTEISMLRALVSQGFERLNEDRSYADKDLDDLHRYVRALGPTLHSLDEKVTGLRAACEYPAVPQ